MVSTWDKSLETGNALIDSQHREVIRLSDELKASDFRSHHQVVREFNTLADYIFFHFLSEEELMKKVHYPDDAKKEMIGQHKEFVFYVKLRVLEFRQSEGLSIRPLQSFLDNWLKTHEFGLDRKLAHWIQKREISSSRAA